MDVLEKIKKSKNIGEILPKLSVDDLEKAIDESSLYYDLGTPVISDKVFDLLIDRLKKINPSSFVLKHIGAPVKGKKTELPYWMGSMDKIKSDQNQINKWIKIYPGPYVISDKLDGISCLLVLNEGKVKLYTRGDGIYGSDISYLSKLVHMQISSLLTQKKYDNIAIRGELIMSIQNFKKYQNDMSNARNMVAGIVNSKKESVNTLYAADVDFVAYEIIYPQFKSSTQLKILNNFNLNVVYYDIYEDIDMQILDNVLIKRKKKSKYEIDGIIVTDNNIHKRNKSGNPSYSFAYKGLTETANVKVIEVLWNPSKDGYLVPRIHFEKVRLSQADLEYTTGFNAKFIIDNGIGPGAIITVVRSGDVIPYVLDVVKPAKKNALPTDYDYEWDKKKVNFILKNSKDNEAVIIQRLTKFIRNIGVDDLSIGIITKLVRCGYDTIPKIIGLQINDFLKLEGFQEKLATKLYNNLQKALKKLDLLTLMDASNAFGRGFGLKKLKIILDNYPDIVDTYTSKNSKKWQEKLLNLEGFDFITVDKFLDFLPDFQTFYQTIKKKINVKPYIKKVKANGIFNGYNIVFTGFRNKDWQKKVEEEGGKVTGSVSKNTTLLVYNDGEENSNKYNQAKKLGVKTITKSKFSEKYNM